MPTQNIDVAVNPVVGKGFGTYLGVGSALLAAIGALYAAIQSNDVATAGASAAAIIAIFKTLDGRFAQATAAIQTHAVAIAPWIDEAQDVAAGNVGVGNAPIDEGRSVPDPKA